MAGEEKNAARERERERTRARAASKERDEGGVETLIFLFFIPRVEERRRRGEGGLRLLLFSTSFLPSFTRNQSITIQTLTKTFSHSSPKNSPTTRNCTTSSGYRNPRTRRKSKKRTEKRRLKTIRIKAATRRSLKSARTRTRFYRTRRRESCTITTARRR